LARGKKEVAIVFDDLTRPTKVYQLVPFILEELYAGGVSQDSIRFIASLGCHRALNSIELRKKLGSMVVETYPVYNHNPYENCEYLGKTSRGTPVSINAEVMRCDLKIGIGCIVPHVSRGFGGGGKIISPGIASIDTIEFNHRKVAGRTEPIKGHPLGKIHPTVGLGKYDNNVMRFDIEEISRMAGLDFIVNPVLNLRRDPVELFVGDPVAAHVEGVRVAREAYLTEKERDAHVVIANAYAKSNQARNGLLFASRSLGETGSTLILIANNPEGQMLHYFAGVFGEYIGGRNWGPRFHPVGAKTLYILSEYPDPVSAKMIADPSKIRWFKCWRDILRKLTSTYGKSDTIKVIVYPDATLQYFQEE
jgi:nickel-dependent lactate racemase